jgi:trehalose synthase-fused probable maltokinase
MGRFLATRTSFRATPTLLGALVLEGAAGGTLGLVHRFVPNTVDGWKYTLEQFRRAGPVDAAFLGEMRELGRRVGELHHALASDANDPVFSPEPVLQEDLQRWSASIVGELGVTLADAGRLHVDLERQRERLMEYAKRLAHVTPSGQKIRIHGDLHLGQVLVAAGDAVIVDFEGEPARPLAERRAKFHPARDVAGVLRSFDYLCRVAAMDYAAAQTTQGDGVAAQVPPALDAWRAGALQDFLAVYFETIGDAPAWPADRRGRTRLLDFFVAWKAVYELGYELNNRPSWAGYPAEALLGLLAGSK